MILMLRLLLNRQIPPTARSSRARGNGEVRARLDVFEQRLPVHALGIEQVQEAGSPLLETDARDPAASAPLA
jgi:hypothetical protein